MDIFQIHKTCFLTTIDRFSKLGSVHKLTDKNMITVRTKLEERLSLLGKPEVLIMDNEFNNALIKMFCCEKDIQPHFTTPNSHTGNSDIERLHSSILEHIRIIKGSNENIDTEELVIRAIGFYNNSIHSTTKLKPMDFINRINLNFEEIANRMRNKKEHVIRKINASRDKIANYNVRKIYKKNPKASRQKTAKRFLETDPNTLYKIDLANIKRPLKFTGNKDIAIIDDDHQIPNCQGDAGNRRDKNGNRICPDTIENNRHDK